MWNLDDKSLFRSAALGELRTAKVDMAELVVDNAVTAFMPNEDENVINEVVRFREFIKGVSFTLRRAEIERLTVSLVVPAGEGQVNIGLSANIQPLNRETGDFQTLSDAEITASTVGMIKKLFAILSEVRAASPQIQRPPTSPNTTNSDKNSARETEEQTHTSSTIKIETNNGKKYYRVRAGWFSQYGAPVYPEVLTACGYESVMSMSDGEYPFVHPITVKVDGAGKPKVIAIN